MAFNANEQIVVDLFIAAYGRAPAQSGLDFFTGKLDSGEMTSADISAFMLDTANNPEAATRYPDSGTTADKVNTVFQNVLGRAVATAEGLTYWTDRVDNEDGFTMSDLIDAVITNAKNHAVDAATLENKSEVVEYFLTKVPAASQAGTQVSTDSVITTADVTAAKAGIDNAVSGPVKLTNIVDTLTGTSADDVYDATTNVDSLQTADSIVDASTDDADSLEAQMTSSLGTTDNGTGLDPQDGPTITNIETITLRDEQEVGVYNVANITGTKTLNIDSKESTLFNSGDDVAALEIREADGADITNLVAIDNTKALNLTEVSNDLNVVLKADVVSLKMEAQDESDQHKTSVELKGSSALSFGLSNDNDQAVQATDGASFAEVTLVSSDAATTITLAADTTLNNVTDMADGDAADGADDAAALAHAQLALSTSAIFIATSLQSGVDVLGDDTESAGQTNLAIADSLVLDGDKDITIIGTAVQLDEAVIVEKDEATSDDMTSTLVLTSDVDGASIDLTVAEVDRVKVSATTSAAAVSEIDVDEDTIVEVNAIADATTLIVTGDSETDTLDIEINTGNAASAMGSLILGGDAHSNTTDFDGATAATAGGTGPEGSGGTGATAAVLDIATADADTAIVTVTSNSNLNLLDVSQLTSKSWTLLGSEDLTVGTLIMGGQDQSAHASILKAEAYTGDFTADLVVPINNGYDDGVIVANNADDFGVNGDAGEGNRILLGSGNDVLGNVGIVATAANGDDIAMGAGDDIVEIGSISAAGVHADDAVSAEIWGQAGRDTFVFQSAADTTNGADSYVQIEDFDAGHSGDQVEFKVYRDQDAEGATNPDTAANAEIYDNGRIIADTSTAMATNTDLVDGNVVLVSTADVDTFGTANALAMFGNTAGTVDSVFDDNDYNSAANAAWDEWIFVVGETSGNDGVKLFLVTLDGTADTAATADVNDGYTATLIGQLQNTTEDINISTITDENFDFL